MGFIQMILMVIFAIILGIAYHKIFDVTYFSGKAIFSEIIVCLMLGGGLIASKLICIMKVLLPIAIVAVIILVIVSKVKKEE